ncbi:hypothetical protein [aff. Roholtiella sp. LEGE 12411]|uniref:hypothetical protein n=1 Tax=aff. Roholtiella sp. LEGE 12411 TaxID=1828822 RepID=UPI0019FE1B7B|nr:hypothetical protein [aff. Roholtiella sp. LEGE 12411]
MNIHREISIEFQRTFGIPDDQIYPLPQYNFVRLGKKSAIADHSPHKCDRIYPLQ